MLHAQEADWNFCHVKLRKVQIITRLCSQYKWRTEPLHLHRFQAGAPPSSVPWVDQRASPWTACSDARGSKTEPQGHVWSFGLNHLEECLGFTENDPELRLKLEKSKTWRQLPAPRGHLSCFSATTQWCLKGARWGLSQLWLELQGGGFALFSSAASAHS